MADTLKHSFRLGIRQKTVLLVLVLSALQVAAVGWYLFNANKRIVVEHELVDLGDEAQLRGWEIVDRIDVLKADLRTLALDKEVSRLLTESPGDAAALSELFEKKCQEWNGYCSVTVSRVEAGREEELQLDTPMVARLPDLDGSRAALVGEIQGMGRSGVRVSKAVRENAEVIFRDGPPPTTKWMPVIWGAVTFRLSPGQGKDNDSGQTPPADAPNTPDAADAADWGPYFKVVIGLNLDSSSWSTDPRHLAFMLDERDMSYIIHPSMDTAATLADRDVFDWKPPVERVNNVRADSDNPTSLIEEIREQDETGAVASLGDAARRSRPPVARVALVEQVGLTAEYQRYFREGTATEILVDRRNALAQWQKDVLAEVDSGTIYENLFNWRMRALGQQFAPKGLRVGGISGQVKTIRILGSTEGDVRELSKQLVREMNNMLALRVLPAEEGVVFPPGTADRAGPETDLPAEAKSVRWQSIIPCRTSDLVCVRLRIDDTATVHADPVPEEIPAGQRQAKHYWFIYAVFHDELAASVEGELWPSVRRAALGMVFAGIIAALLSMLAVRPLIRMIQGARFLSTLSGKRLHANIRTMADQIPVNRSDEVGDIARAARRLFVTITENHRKLNEHQRAIERHKDDLEIQVERAVAELKAKNAELEAAADEKDKFLASVSHELRTPLTIVAGNLQLLLRKELGEKEKSYVNKSLAASKKLEALIRDLLDIQKIIMGGMSLDPAEFDIPELLAEIEDTLQANAEKNNNVLKVSCEGLGKVFGDRVRLNQILTNLVSNSCKFTENGVVTVDGHGWEDSETDAKWMKFTVTDSGRGMNEEEQQKVFTRFYTNKKANESGTGLGLDICRRLGELMGGRVYLKHSAPGEGSVFVVEMPENMMLAGRKAEGEKLAGRPKKTHRRGFSAIDRSLKNYPVDRGSPPTVLVIDDEPGIQELMNQHLAARGYRVISAESGAVGIAMAKQEKPNLITLDVMMDGSDGWEVLQKLKADPDTAAIPVVMVTILDREDKGFALGADDYLTKPVDWEQMFSVLGRLTNDEEKRSALIIDDDESTRLLFKSVLSKDGWEIAEAGNGVEGLERLHEKRPGVIVLDLMMPEMDGFEFLKEFNAHEDWSDIPVIVVTAKEMNSAERRLLDESVARVIQKGTQTAGQLLDEVQHWGPHRYSAADGEPDAQAEPELETEVGDKRGPESDPS